MKHYSWLAMDNDPVTPLSLAQMGSNRQLVRKIASQLAAERTFPTAELVRKRILALTKGERSPSATTVQGEMKAWYVDTFWPTYNILGDVDNLPAIPEVSSQLKRVYTDGFRALVVGTVEAVQKAWSNERESLRQQLSEAELATVGQRAEIERREQEIREIKEQLQAASLEAAKADQSAKDQAAVVAALRQSLADANATAREMAEKQASHERELNQIREEERARADQLVGQARDDARAVRVELDTQRQTTKRLEQAVDALQSELQSERGKVYAAEAARAALTAELQALKQAHAAEVQRLADSVRQLREPAQERPRKIQAPSSDRVIRNRLRKNTLR